MGAKAVRTGALITLVLLACEVLAAQPRSHGAITAFKLQHPCPSTSKSTGPCPGYVIDHVIALACGGPDKPDNMQWQTVGDAKAKDRWERVGCKSLKPESKHRVVITEK